MSHVDYHQKYIEEKEAALALEQENHRLKEELKVAQCGCKAKFEVLLERVRKMPKIARHAHTLYEKTWTEIVSATNAKLVITIRKVINC